MNKNPWSSTVAGPCVGLANGRNIRYIAGLGGNCRALQGNVVVHTQFLYRLLSVHYFAEPLKFSESLSKDKKHKVKIHQKC